MKQNHLKNKQTPSQTAKEKRNTLLEQIKTLSENYKTNPDDLIELMNFSANFYNYSLNNTMLIYSQNPGATFVQSYDAWKSMGYPVKKGEKGMRILVPVKTTYLKLNENDLIKLSQATKEQVESFKDGKIESFQRLSFMPGTTFDISQTTYPPEKYPQLFSLGYPSAVHDLVTEGLVAFYEEKLNVPVSFKDLHSIALRGYYNPEQGEIVINNRLNSTEKLSTLTHELGHALSKHKKGEEKSSSQIEWEADAISIMIQSSMGLEISNTRKQHLKDHYTTMMSSSQNFNSLKLDEILGNVLATYKEYKPTIDECIEKYVTKDQIQELLLQESFKTGSEKLYEKYQFMDFSLPEERTR